MIDIVLKYMALDLTIKSQHLLQKECARQQSAIANNTSKGTLFRPYSGLKQQNNYLLNDDHHSNRPSAKGNKCSMYEQCRTVDVADKTIINIGNCCTSIGAVRSRQSKRRPLCGRYVRSGRAASVHVLHALRMKIINRRWLTTAVQWGAAATMLTMINNQQQRQQQEGQLQVHHRPLTNHSNPMTPIGIAFMHQWPSLSVIS